MKFRSRVAACLSGVLLLTGCSVDISDVLPTTSSSSSAAAALAVGDEPYAVQAAAQVLAQGGSAADAATAMYFALAVTYPVAAGLGGGGICLVNDRARGSVEEFDFLARDASGGGAYAVPGNVRGFALMQSLYGALPWQRDVSPGEGYAAAGFPISHALASRLAASRDIIRLDASLAAEFLDEAGAPKPVGAMASNADLATTLAAVRTGGPNAFYRGSVGARLLAYTSAQGGGIDVPEYARYQASRSAPQATQIGGETVYFPSRQTGAGAFAGALFDVLTRSLMTHTGAEDQRAAVVVAIRQALTQFGVASLPPDLGATGFAATDANGQSVACAVTMNGPFGAGRTAPGTGVTLARAPSSSEAGLAAAFLTPVIATGNATLAGAGAGGPNGTAAMGYALARLGAGESLASRSDLRSTGDAPYDTVNVIVCQNGSCAALPDPGSMGLGAAAPVR